jgi:hypothetical protein
LTTCGRRGSVLLARMWVGFAVPQGQDKPPPTRWPGHSRGTPVVLTGYSRGTHSHRELAAVEGVLDGDEAENVLAVLVEVRVAVHGPNLDLSSGCSRGTHRVLTGYSRATHAELTGYSWGYSWGTHGVRKVGVFKDAVHGPELDPSRPSRCDVSQHTLQHAVATRCCGVATRCSKTLLQHAAAALQHAVATYCCSTLFQDAAAASQHGTYAGGVKTCASRFATAALSSTQPHASIAAVSSSPPASSAAVKKGTGPRENSGF